jgi:hypothetical protein
MTTRANNLEGGTNGVAILTTDTGSGDAFTQASSTANQTTTRYYTNVSPIKGSLSARLTYDATGTVLLGWDAAFNQGTSPLTNGQLIIRFYFKALADSSATNTSLFQWRNATTFGGSIGLSPGLILRALTRTGTTIGTSSYVISLNTVYRVEMIVDPGTSTTTGRVRYAIYLGDSTTNLLTTAVDVSGIDCGSAPITSARWGKTAAAGTCDYVVDALYADDVSTAYIGPVAAASPPTVTVGGPVTTTLGATTTRLARRSPCRAHRLRSARSSPGLRPTTPSPAPCRTLQAQVPPPALPRSSTWQPRWLARSRSSPTPVHGRPRVLLTLLQRWPTSWTPPGPSRPPTRLRLRRSGFS